MEYFARYYRNTVREIQRDSEAGSCSFLCQNSTAYLLQNRAWTRQHMFIGNQVT